jgi:hypothetical protein
MTAHEAIMKAENVAWRRAGARIEVPAMQGPRDDRGECAIHAMSAPHRPEAKSLT